MKKWLFVMTLSLIMLLAAACGSGTGGTETSWEPLIREDLMWDTDMLFSREVQVTEGSGTFPNQYGKTEALFYDGPAYRGKQTTVFAYLGYPSAPMPEGGYPAVVLVHGGGGCAFYEWVEYWNGKGYVAIAPDFYAQQYGSFQLQNGKAPANPNGGPTDSGSFGSTRETCKDSWIYHSVFNIISAHNLLRADERVNADRIGLTGISWGSVLTMITSGVDYRFGAFAPVYGSGFLAEAPGIVSNSAYQPPMDLQPWMELFDPSSYLPFNNRPTLFTVGTNESFFSPLLQQFSAELCQGPVFYSYRWELRHYHRWKDEEGMCHIAEFFDDVLCGEKAPFLVESQKREGRSLTVKLTDSSAVKQTRLIYTESTEGLSTGWKWSFAYVSENFRDDTITVEIPETAVLAFVEFSDLSYREYFASSSLVRFA